MFTPRQQLEAAADELGRRIADRRAGKSVDLAAVNAKTDEVMALERPGQSGQVARSCPARRDRGSSKQCASPFPVRAPATARGSPLLCSTLGSSLKGSPSVTVPGVS